MRGSQREEQTWTLRLSSRMENMRLNLSHTPCFWILQFSYTGESTEKWIQAKFMLNVKYGLNNRECFYYTGRLCWLLETTRHLRFCCLYYTHTDTHKHAPLCFCKFHLAHWSKPGFCRWLPPENWLLDSAHPNNQKKTDWINHSQ